jgi:hypothetical protein|tara:strand:- start:4778 stop:6076 length:1299 start_codon:yes stop_codon:yes gene_type:complete
MEIFYIITEILFIITILSLPIFLIEKKYYLKSLDINFIDKLSISLIFFINILFFSSVFNITLNLIFYIYLFFLLILLLVNYRNISLPKIKANYFFLILLLFVFFISIDLGDQIYFGWDAKRNWVFKTLNFYQGQRIENLSIFNNSDYPHLGAFLWSFFWKFPHNNYEYLGRIFYVFFYVLAIISFSNCLKTETFEKLIFSILLISLTYNYELFSGLQDILIFSTILLFARVSFLMFDKKSKPHNLILIFILFGIINMLCWFKNEGVFYSIFLVFSLLITCKFSKKEKLYLILGTFIIFSLRIFLFNYYSIELNPNYFEMEKTTFLIFSSFLFKLKTITFYLIIYLTQNPTYIITFPLLGYLVYKYPYNNITKFILYFLVLNIIFIYLTYMYKMVEVELLLKASLSRVIFQTSGFYFLIIAICLNNYKSGFRK